MADLADPAHANVREYQGRSAYLLNELGIAIVFPNVRGSWGFGKAFGRLDDGIEAGRLGTRTSASLLDWIETQPTLDKKRVMVTGVSYGGYMTYAVAEMYSSGCAVRLRRRRYRISSAISGTTDPTRPEDRRAEYGDERDPEMREFLKRISPVTRPQRFAGSTVHRSRSERYAGAAGAGRGDGADRPRQRCSRLD